MPICLPPPVPQTPAPHPLADACCAPLQIAHLPGPSVRWPLHKERSPVDEGGIKVLSKPAVIPIALKSIALPFSRRLLTQLPLSRSTACSAPGAASCSPPVLLHQEARPSPPCSGFIAISCTLHNGFKIFITCPVADSF